MITPNESCILLWSLSLVWGTDFCRSMPVISYYPLCVQNLCVKLTLWLKPWKLDISRSKKVERLCVGGLDILFLLIWVVSTDKITSLLQTFPREDYGLYDVLELLLLSIIKIIIIINKDNKDKLLNVKSDYGPINNI